jgi:hypothetical protein
VSLERPIEPFARCFYDYEVWFVRWLEKLGISTEYCPRQLICYKDGADPALSTNSSRATLNWFEPAGPNRPENRLTGLSYRFPCGAPRTPPAGAPTPAAVDFVVRNALSWVFEGTGSATATPSVRTSPVTRWMPPNSKT